jgi:hypothetical protein
MSDLHASQPSNLTGGSADEMSVLFAQMVLQQANLAMMLLGKTPHPESGQTLRDLEGAKLFIDQLEMLEVKTRGNLSKEEAALLKQSLMALRMAFVECVNSNPPPPPVRGTAEGAAPSAGTASPAEPSPAAAPAAAAGDEESRKKFTKKY